MEVVLAGIHMADYECPETGMNFEKLVAYILDQTEIPRLRISSLDPQQVSESFLNLYQDPRLCPSFHLSIQSAQTEVLQSMKRWYDASEVERSLLEIQRYVPGAYVSMDVIVGFPAESEAHFAETHERLQNLPWTKIHVFPYSERQGTIAAKTLPDSVSASEKQRRSQILRDLSAQRYEEMALSQKGQIKKALRLKSKRDHERVQFLTRDHWTLTTGPTHIVGEVDLRVMGLGEKKNTLGELYLQAEPLL